MDSIEDWIDKIKFARRGIMKFSISPSIISRQPFIIDTTKLVITVWHKKYLIFFKSSDIDLYFDNYDEGMEWMKEFEYDDYKSLFRSLET